MKSYKIKAPKDIHGFYILPDSVPNHEKTVNSLRYHTDRMKPKIKNLLFAIVCAADQETKRDTIINGWNYDHITVNGVQLEFKNYYLDEDENMLYEFEGDQQLLIRALKLKKILK